MPTASKASMRACALMLLFGCALAMALVGPVRRAAAQTVWTVEVCKTTIPVGSTTPFQFAHFNTFGAQGGFSLTDGHCQSFSLPVGVDKLNTFIETVPPGWTLYNITCTNTTNTNMTSVVTILGATVNPSAGFEPGDVAVTIDQNEPHVKCTFFNKHNSATGTLDLRKIVNPDPQNLGSTFSFPATVTCTDPATGTTSSYATTLQTGQTASVSPPLGATCTTAETLPLPALPSGCTWLPPHYTPQPIVIGPGTNVQSVQNGYQCLASVKVDKLLKPDPLNLAGTLPPFAITLTCAPQPPAGNPVTVTVAANNTVVANNLMPNSTCTVAETQPLPALPPNCTWLPPKFSPQPVIIGASGSAVETVTNGYQCTRSVHFEKTVNPDPMGIGSQLLFTINAICTDPSTGLTATYSSSPIHGNSGGVINGIPAGATCTFSETKPVLPAGCTWTIEQYTPPTLSATATYFSVANGYQCSTPKDGTLNVLKTIKNNTGAPLSGLTFPVTISCSQLFTVTFGPVNPSLTAGVTQTFNIPLPPSNYATQCGVTEQQPLPLPSNACPPNQSAMWSQPTYSPAQTVQVAAGQPVTITVTNQLTCGPANQLSPATCDPGTTSKRGRECACRYPGMVRVSASACACAAGTNLIAGRGCVRPLDCRAPLVPNAAGSACVCPPGTKQRGRECVALIECRPPAKSNGRGGCECPAGMVLRANECVDLHQPSPGTGGPRPRDGVRP